MLTALRKAATKAFSLMEKEKDAIEELHKESHATIARVTEKDPGLKPFLDKAHAYAVFPSVGKAAAVIGGAFGKGEVFRGEDLIGYAAVIQVTLGVQLGGDTFSQIIAFESKQALDRFKQSKTRFAANASAVLVKAGAASTARFESGVAVFVYTEGGMMLELAIGAQKFIFKPAVMGRTKSAPATATRRQKTRSTRSRQPGRKTRESAKSQSSRRSKARSSR